MAFVFLISLLLLSTPHAEEEKTQEVVTFLRCGQSAEGFINKTTLTEQLYEFELKDDSYNSLTFGVCGSDLHGYDLVEDTTMTFYDADFNKIDSVDIFEGNVLDDALYGNLYSCADDDSAKSREVYNILNSAYRFPQGSYYIGIKGYDKTNYGRFKIRLYDCTRIQTTTGAPLIISNGLHPAAIAAIVVGSLFCFFGGVLTLAFGGFGLLKSSDDKVDNMLLKSQKLSSMQNQSLIQPGSMSGVGGAMVMTPMMNVTPMNNQMMMMNKQMNAAATPAANKMSLKEQKEQEEKEKLENERKQSKAAQLEAQKLAQQAQAAAAQNAFTIDAPVAAANADAGDEECSESGLSAEEDDGEEVAAAAPAAAAAAAPEVSGDDKAADEKVLNQLYNEAE